MVLPVSPLEQLPRARKSRPKRPRVQLPAMPPLDAPVLLSLSFVVEGPPQPKQRARKGRGGHWFTPDETTAYENAVQRAAWAALARFGLMNTWPLAAYYRVTVRAFFGDARRQDWDNVFKAVADGLNTVLWHDDTQVLDPLGSKRIDRERPRTEVTVEVIAC